MKTKESNSGNRKQNAKKTLLKFTTVAFCFVLINITVNAQDNWKYFSTSNDSEMIAMLEGNHSNIESVSLRESRDLLFYIEPAIEESLELESWMTNGLYFNGYDSILDVEVENNLELEEWMINESYFTIPLIVEHEEELKLESWMMNEKIWM